MAKEQLINDPITGMYSWAIKAKQNADLGKYAEAEKFLRNINTQGKRLEWRGWRLRPSSETEEVKELKRRISEARAAALQALFYVEHLEKLAKKEGKKPAEIAAIKKKEKDYQKETVRNIAILIHGLKKVFAAQSKKTEHLDLLTKLVTAKLKKFVQDMYTRDPQQYEHVRLWLAAPEVEYLPNGIPYKVIDNPTVHQIGGTFIDVFGDGGLNQPLILVSSILSPSERKSVAMHEFVEWSRRRTYNSGNQEAHVEAFKRENPRLRDSVRKKASNPRAIRGSSDYSNIPYAGYNESLARAEKKKQQGLVRKLFNKLFS